MQALIVLHREDEHGSVVAMWIDGTVKKKFLELQPLTLFNKLLLLGRHLACMKGVNEVTMPAIDKRTQAVPPIYAGNGLHGVFAQRVDMGVVVQPIVPQGGSIEANERQGGVELAHEWHHSGGGACCGHGEEHTLLDSMVEQSCGGGRYERVTTQ